MNFMPFKAKNGLLAIIIVLSTLSMAYAQGENVPLKQYSITEISQLSAQKPKKLVIDVYTDWCSWCKKMDKTTYQNEGVIQQINEDFYFVKLNAETRDSIFFDNKIFTFQNQYKANEFAIALLNGQMSYPSTVFLDEKLGLLTVVPGYLTPKDISPILKYFGKDFHLKMKWDEFIKTNSEK
jgi:thioredoxin-related protein